MTAGRQGLFWTGVLGVLVLALWLLRPVLLPFLLGMAIGYLLDPVVDRMCRWGLSRGVAAGVIILGSYGTLAVALLLVTPLLIDQAVALVANLPALVSWIYRAALPLLRRTSAAVGMGNMENLTQPLTESVQQMVGPLGSLVKEVLGHSLALVNVTLLLAITPLVAFYLLRDWPRVLAEVDSWLPREHAATIRAQAREIDRVLAGFARGTAMVCLALGIFYAVGLTAVGLDFGLVIGLAAGAVSFVPYVGTLFGLVTSVGVAIYQFWPYWGKVVVVLVVFLTGQLLSDYVLTPRLVGNRVGLHPLWVIFGVLAGGALFGFVGILVAVPACAVIGVLARFAIERYKASPLYRGTAGTP